MSYALKLDSEGIEYIIAPFHDPEHSPRLPVGIDAEPEVLPLLERRTLWDSTVFEWNGGKDVPRPFTFTLRVLAPFAIGPHDTLVLCYALPQDAVLEVSLLDGANVPFSNWTRGEKGQGARQEFVVPLTSQFAAACKKGREFSGIALRVTVMTQAFGLFSLSWIGLRDGAAFAAVQRIRGAVRPDWSPWLLPESEWGERRFERGLVFDEQDLEGVRAKLAVPAWRAHFDLLESRAASFLDRDPEASCGDYLPNHDKRYQRAAENGRQAYHWEALVLAFVGLVRRDNAMIRHALRYLMCMVHARYWTESAEHRQPSSTWSHRCFMEEMTSTSVALLADWLAFALRPEAKTLIRQALWERGLTPVKRDLLVFDYLYTMNQGAVFSRALVLGGLYLEGAWPRLGRYVDDAYATMGDILSRYVAPDGGVHEGPGYLCQTLTGTLWAVIAYNRARGKDWRPEATRLFGRTDRYIRAMSMARPGRVIPSGDCRVEWMGGDGIPILAALDPGSACANILEACLQAGTVHTLTGTLANSGGLIGMVYGPHEVKPSQSVVPERDLLSESGKFTATFGGRDDPALRLWVSASTQGITHAHRDSGQFVLEADGEAVFIDRGMVEYWYMNAHVLSRSCMHNVLTLAGSDGSMPCQSVPVGSEPMRFAEDGQELLVPDNGVWACHMKKCARRFVIRPDNAAFKIIDDVDLTYPGRVAFHLQALVPFRIEGKSARVLCGDTVVTVAFPWADKVWSEESLVDLKHRAVYRLVAVSPNLKKPMSLETKIEARRVER